MTVTSTKSTGGASYSSLLTLTFMQKSISDILSWSKKPILTRNVGGGGAAKPPSKQFPSALKVKSGNIPSAIIAPSRKLTKPPSGHAKFEKSRSLRSSSSTKPLISAGANVNCEDAINGASVSTVFKSECVDPEFSEENQQQDFASTKEVKTEVFLNNTSQNDSDPKRSCKGSGTSDSESDSSDFSEPDQTAIRFNSALVDLADDSDEQEQKAQLQSDTIKVEIEEEDVKPVVKEEIDAHTNKRYGHDKLRHRPARPRDYTYRKQEWCCPICKQKMKYGSRFLHLQLKHDKPYLCKFCTFRSKTRKALQAHVKQHRLKMRSKKFKCGYCCSSFCFNETLQRHLKIVHNKKVFFLNCAICNMTFLTTVGLGQHYKKKHPQEKKFQCSICDTSYSILNSLRHHMLAKHNESGELPFKCDQCELQFVRKDKLKLHQLRHTRMISKRAGQFSEKEQDRKCSHITPTLKGSNELVLCDHCGHVCEVCTYRFQSHRAFALHTHKNFCGICVRKYPDEKSFSLHIAYHESETKIEHRCEICKFGFLSVKNLNIHAYKMHRLKMSFTEYKCDKCSKLFKNYSLLSIHKAHHDLKHKCSVCSRSFITLTTLNTHINRVHTMERPYKCEECGKGFVRNTDLTRHKKIHIETVVSFTCHICDKVLKSNRNLQLHLNIHASTNDKKTYKCDQCEKAFVQKCYLKKHKTLHADGPKQYQCSDCDKSYLNAQGLSEHRVSKHGLKSTKYKCENCKRSYITKTGLASHVRESKCDRGRRRKRVRQKKVKDSESESETVEESD